MKTLAICGAGTMGRGIALSAIQSGFNAVLHDSFEGALEQSKSFINTQLQSSVAKGRITEAQSIEIASRFTITSDTSAMNNADIVIEAIIENLQAKIDLFKIIENECSGENTILATNTSSISINSIARHLKRPENFVGLHFFNPAHIMKLVEIIRGTRTSDDVVKRCVELSKKLGKSPAIAKDVPGFIVNRVARNYYNEAQRVVTEGTATIEQVDTLMKSIGFKMGPFELMDLIGVDTNLDVTKSIYAQYFNEPRFQPSVMQQQYVDAGLHGKKTGRGFYDYTTKDSNTDTKS